MKKALFYIDGGPAYIGYTNGDRWNGWATPHFTFEEAQKIQAEFNQGDGLRMFYDCQADKFILQYEGEDVPYVWEGEDVQTEDGIKHLYGIGAYSHIWDEVDKNDKRYLAQTIDEWLYEYDEGAYEDYHGNRDVVKIIINKFDDIEVFAKAHAIMNNATLDSNEVYEKISEVLNL